MSIIRTYSNAQTNEEKLGPYFKVKEFACKDGSDTVKISTTLTAVLTNIRTHFKKPVKINSAYRTESYNKKVGGASNSQHLYGRAADIKIDGVSNIDIANYADKVMSGYGGIGLYPTFVHIDTREGCASWDETNSGWKRGSSTVDKEDIDIYVDDGYSSDSTQAKTLEWGVEAPSVSDMDENLVTFSRGRLDIADDMYIGTDVVRNVKEKTIEAGAGYLIYFDDILMNRYITGFSCQVSTDGRINYAHISLIYAPPFWKTEIRDVNTHLYRSYNGIDNGTNVRIFVMNVVTRKFDIVFDGNVKGKSRRKTAKGQRAIDVTAVNQLEWLDRLTVPVSIPLSSTISTGDKIKWMGQGIDVGAIDTIVFARETSFKGKTLTQYVSELVDKTFRNNWLFKDTNTAGNWDDAVGRICIMGDISEKLRKAQCIDFVISASVEIVDKMLAMLNEVSTTLLIEFFADRDGLIRLKPPFWNQPVLADHIIDPSFILSETENTDYQNFYTRVISTGGMEEWRNQNSALPDFLTPVGCYVGNMTDGNKSFWADFTGVQGSFAEKNDTKSGVWISANALKYSLYQMFDTSKPGFDQDDRSFPFEWMKNFYIVSDYYDKKRNNYGDWLHSGIDFSAIKQTQLTNTYEDAVKSRRHEIYSVKNIANATIRVSRGSYDSFLFGVKPPDYSKDSDLYNIEITDNRTGIIYTYAHLSDVALIFKPPEWAIQRNSPSLLREYYPKNIKSITTTTLIGYAGDKGHGENNCWHLGIKDGPIYRDPITFVRKWKGQEERRIQKENEDKNAEADNVAAASADESNILNYSSNYNYGHLSNLLKPSDDERKYGPTIYNTTQSMIKFTTANAITSGTSDEGVIAAATALRMYSQFMYYMLNSNLDTLEAQVVAMPWLRPGFNVWYNPIDTDKIYYLTSIRYNGDPQSGCTSELSLCMGRERVSFKAEPNYFGSEKVECDNLLISKFISGQRASDFGRVLGPLSDYNGIREAMYQFYQSEQTDAISADSSTYLNSLYGNVNHSPNAKKLIDTLDTSNVSGKAEEGISCKSALVDVTEAELKAINARPATSDTLHWPCWNKYVICNGYDKKKHPGIDVYYDSRGEVHAPGTCYLKEVGKNSGGYYVRLYLPNRKSKSNHDNTYSYLFLGHLTSLGNKIPKLEGKNQIVFEFKEEKKVETTMKPSVFNNYNKPHALAGHTLQDVSKTETTYLDGGILLTTSDIIGYCDSYCHIELKSSTDSESISMSENVLDYINKANSGVFTFDSTVWNDDVVLNNIAEGEAFISKFESGEDSDFCKSKKFFSREMSYEEINSQIKECYAEAPAVIKNRGVALRKRVEEAEMFVQRYYDVEAPSAWQDVKRIKEYSQDLGYSTGEWVDNLYIGDTPDVIDVEIGSFTSTLSYKPNSDRSAIISTEYQASPEIIEFIKNRESFSEKRYWDYTHYSIGYGTFCGEDEYTNNATITREEAHIRLMGHIVDKGQRLANFLTHNNLTLSQQQFDALLSLTYNCPGWLTDGKRLQTALIDRDFDKGVPDAFMLYVNADGARNDGLVARRSAEVKIWKDGIYGG